MTEPQHKLTLALHTTVDNLRLRHVFCKRRIIFPTPQNSTRHYYKPRGAEEEVNLTHFGN